MITPPGFSASSECGVGHSARFRAFGVVHNSPWRNDVAAARQALFSPLGPLVPMAAVDADQRDGGQHMPARVALKPCVRSDGLARDSEWLRQSGERRVVESARQPEVAARHYEQEPERRRGPQVIDRAVLPTKATVPPR